MMQSPPRPLHDSPQWLKVWANLSTLRGFWSWSWLQFSLPYAEYFKSVFETLLCTLCSWQRGYPFQLGWFFLTQNWFSHIQIAGLHSPNACASPLKATLQTDLEGVNLLVYDYYYYLYASPHPPHSWFFFSPRNQDYFFLKFSWFIFKCPSKAMKLLRRGLIRWHIKV